uniref:Uncharacterized protein n=1 Tax=viral metagenome TaxID=1070528 RepID=A0A6M3IXE5_9ZZZZ
MEHVCDICKKPTPPEDVYCTPDGHYVCRNCLWTHHEENDYHVRGDKLADRHVDWALDLFVPIIKAFAKAEFVHGYKHGLEEAKGEDDGYQDL